MMITVQIALSSLEKPQRLNEILSIDPYIAEWVSGSIDQCLLYSQITSAQASQASSPFIVIIDGLDECQRNNDQCWILTGFAHSPHTPPPTAVLDRQPPWVSPWGSVLRNRTWPTSQRFCLFMVTTGLLVMFPCIFAARFQGYLCSAKKHRAIM